MFLLLTISFLKRIRPLFSISLRMAAFVIFFLCVAGLTDKRLINGYGIYNYSARDLSRALESAGADPRNLRLVHVRRSPQYQLNFYFHSELKEWSGEARAGEFLAGESISCASLKLGTACRSLWGEIDKTDDWELLQISEPSLPGGLGGGTGSGSAGSSLDYREPR